jgi:hypothetical protein
MMKPVPTITRASGNASQSISLGSGINNIVYYTTTSSAVISKTDGSFPSNVFGAPSGSPSGTSFTIYGTPSATGTFGYSLTAALNGCTSIPATGTITVNPPPPHFYSSNTWSIASRTWSDRVVGNPSNCSQVTTLSTTASVTPPAEYLISDASGVERYYYNWTCALNICPSGWSLPTKAQFDALKGATDITTISGIWGWGGYANGSSVNTPTSGGWYWSSTPYGSSSTFAYYFCYVVGVGVPDQLKYWGMQVRCVK